MPCFLPVRDLRAGVLDGDDGVGRDVRQAHGRIGGVDVLAARAPRAHDVRADVFRVDEVVARGVAEAVLGHLVHACAREAREHHDGDGAGVGAALGFGRGHALHAVDAGFAAEQAVGALAFDFEDRFLHLAFVAHTFCLVELEDAGVEAVPLAEGLVHPEEVTCEKGSLGAAGARTEFEEAWKVCELVDRNETGSQTYGGLF